MSLQDEQYNDLHFWGGSSLSTDTDLMTKYFVPLPPARRGATTHAATAASVSSVDASFIAAVARKGTLAAAAAGRGSADLAALSAGEASPRAGREDSPAPCSDFITSYNPFAS